jgi:hypothetical protein
MEPLIICDRCGFEIPADTGFEMNPENNKRMHRIEACFKTLDEFVTKGGLPVAERRLSFEQQRAFEHGLRAAEHTADINAKEIEATRTSFENTPDPDAIPDGALAVAVARSFRRMFPVERTVDLVDLRAAQHGEGFLRPADEAAPKKKKK